MKLNIQFFGGRGSSSGGASGGGGGNSAGGASGANLAQEFTSANTGVGDYDGGGNPELQKWQQMSDADMGHYLHQISDNTSLAQDPNDPWGYHDNEFQKMVTHMGLNSQATVLSESDFDDYLRKTGQTAMYRGVSGQSAADRTLYSPNNHVGNGMYGDGNYFTTPGDRSTAVGYMRQSGGTNGRILKAALSPNARIVDHSVVQAEIAKLSRRSQRALKKAGTGNVSARTFATNIGEAQMALKMGYNVIHNGWNINVLTRDALVISSSVRKR